MDGGMGVEREAVGYCIGVSLQACHGSLTLGFCKFKTKGGKSSLLINWSFKGGFCSTGYRPRVYP